MPAKKATKAPRKEATMTQGKPSVSRTSARSSPKAPPTPPPAAAPDHDYLVIYEEPDPDGLPADDVLVLDIESPAQSRGEVDVQQKLDVGLTNTTSRLGTFGYIITLIGSLAAVVLMVWFASVYPDGWYNPGGSIKVDLVRTMLTIGTFAFIFLLGGTILTHYGRRIQAKTTLRDVRIIEKSPQNRLQFD